MAVLFTPNFQRSDANGNPYSGAKLYFYASGTTTPITVYQDAGLTTPHASPVVADASGAFAEIFVNTDPFKFVLNTSAGVLIESVDAIPLNTVTFDGLKASATTSYTGVVELATTTETLTGTDTVRAVTPDALAALWEKGSDVASAATVSLGEGSLFHITGTTTITDIDFATPKNGRRATLIFDAALTLTHNATTLLLPGGANITTAANDRCVVVQDNGDNVYAESYTKADGRSVVMGGMTLVGTLTTTSGTTQSLTSIATTYKHLKVVFVGVSYSGASSNINLQVKLSSNNGGAYGSGLPLGAFGANTNTISANGQADIYMTGTNPATKVVCGVANSGTNADTDATTTGLINAIQFVWSDGSTFDAGTIYVYGVS